MKELNTDGKVGFTLTKEDFKWEFFLAGGHGGQNVQKTSTACRCTHLPSGAVAVARDERSQPQNRKMAFQRVVDSKKFQAWAKIELDRRACADRQEAKPLLDLSVTDTNTLVEVRGPDGQWVKE